MDNTVLYNGGYRVLNGYVPFSDYWLVTGPLLDYINAFFFKILGVSWRTFIIHSSIINLFFSLASYYLFTQLGLSNKFSILYAAFIAVLFYPVVGTPFVDHHSTFFLVLAFYSFILGVKKKNYLYFSITPLFFCLSFLSKQTPAVYGLFTIIPLILLYCYFDKKNIKKILSFFIYGSVSAIIFLVLFFIITNININNFYEQYILFAGTIGDYRFSNYSFNLIDTFVKYKFIYIYLLILLVLLSKLLLNKKKNKENIFIILISIILTMVLIFHQFYTLNQNYIFFIIPFLCAIFHIFYKKIFSKNNFLILSIIFCIFIVSKYHIRFNELRKFNELENVDLSKAIDAEILSSDLKNLKWITNLYPNDPERELQNLKEVMNILSNDNSKKILITEYQFLAPALKIYDFSPNQWHHPSVSFPIKGHKYFDSYKKYFIQNIDKNNIKFIYETSENETTITELIIDKNCFKKNRINEMLIKLELLKNCEDLK